MAGAPIRISILANANQARQELSATEGSVKKLGAGIKIAGGAAAAGIAAIGAAAAEAASQAQDTARVSAALGANPQEQAKLGKLAGQLYADNFGDSFTTVIDDIEAVRSSFRDLGTGAELKKVSEQAITFASVFETDVPRAVSVASTVVKSGLAKSATEAFDLFTAASQRVPKALREDLLDAGNEYGQFFSLLGYSGEQAFTSLANASSMGEFGIDKIGDAVKEFTIRATDMSTASVDAYNLIGLNAQTTSDAILKGGDSARTATQNVVKGLLSLKPGAQQANAAIALFGTPIEDLNVAKIPQFLKGLQNGKKGLGDFAGATDRAAKTVGDTAASKIESFKRTITQTFVEEVGNRALPVIGRLAEGGKQVADAYRSGGIDTAVSKLEKLTDTQGKLAPIVDTVVEAGEDLRRILEKVGPAGVEALSGLYPLISPVAIIGKGLGVVADVIEAVPDGILTLGIQAGAAAIILPRLTAAAGAAGTAMMTAGTRAIGFGQALSATGTAAQTRALGQFASAAKTAAGVGGLLALTQGVKDADDATSALKITLGGAALGASVGGPLGAIVGAGAGGAFALYKENTRDAEQATRDAAAAAADAKADYDALRGTLDELTGATSRQTRAFVQDELEKSGVLAKFAAEGVARRTVVNALFGEKNARREVAQFIAEQEQAYDDLTGKIEELKVTSDRVSAVGRGKYVEELKGLQDQQQGIRDTINAYKEQGLELRQGIADQRARGRVLQDFSALAGKIPKRLFTRIDMKGVEPSVEGIARVVKAGKIVDRKTIRALISAVGVETTVKQVRRVADNLKGVDKTKVNLGGYTRGISTSIRVAEREAGQGGATVAKKLRDGTKNAKPDTGAFIKGLQNSIANGRGIAASSSGIGADLKNGFPRGFAGADGLWAGQVRGAVRSAINAGRAEAQTRSPSKKTMKLGHDLSRGLEVGMEKRKPKAKGAGRSLIAAALAGIDAGSDGIGKSIDRITRLIEQQVKMKDKDKEGKREKEIIKSLGAQFKQLRKNGQQQDKNNEKLSAARDRYKSLVEDSKAYSASIREGFVSYGSVVGLGTLGDSTSITSDRIVSQLKARLKAAKDYSALIQRLRKQGLNQTTIQQLLDAGVEGGLATAQALSAGGASAVAQVNSLTGEIAKAGGGLGDAMAKQFKSAGIQAAAGLVAGLEREQKRLDKAADRIGAQIARALKKALGIRSPSRVFKGIGVSTMDGLALGLDETRARSLGAGVGKGVEQGFKRPTLTVGAASQAGVKAGQPNINITINAGMGTSGSALGREVVGAVDAYFKNGGRPTVPWQ